MAKCPLLKKECIKHDCAWYTQVIGKNPQTGEQLNRFACAVEWIPVLLIDNTQQQRQAGAAFEGVRNEMHAGAPEKIARALASLSMPFEDPRKELEHKP
ncbi:MAG: hypothetical protein ACRD4I_15530 [Candidatus Angelobacter sp.]